MNPCERGTPPDAPATPAPRRRRTWCALVVTGVAAMSLLTPLAGPAAAATVHPAGQLNFNELAQEQDEWCWDATGLSVAQFLGHGADVDQNTFCDYARGLSPGDPCPNQPGELTDVQAGWSGTGMSNVGSVADGALDFQTVARSIDAGSPVEVGISWTSGGGHANVLYGYDASSGQLLYADPWPSNPRYGEMDYNSYVSNGEFTWDQSLYGES
ncbi:papain-like cysteine protease family protein [Streptantibioticus cattleyicolor]|uniref:Papain like cysteine protease AvrRpt2 n=1 Tax=Streptantibioticus cattleyicolor (strain ATCC 35852 / DSM 46488 / JCM 4925 / NBRC 14057 / NRRL 8057) TaxID=1003195 RepID=F8JKU5_STREN|nr:papain-like cysteine protease family protein [Streptantibioticus cattleyicolor]AEW99700.1 hypothetical protein SCATT_p15070 [Streptantibioticus cattleyicolor NRRL 8057 = DSM 46488]CCB71262.1 conserved exported protein of unknown function [Streptantibioticus cattleyicolor NRRL 8057 = DSM 46488]